jgi:hypothetical protein
MKSPLTTTSKQACKPSADESRSQPIVDAWDARKSGGGEVEPPASSMIVVGSTSLVLEGGKYFFLSRWWFYADGVTDVQAKNVNFL